MDILDEDVHLYNNTGKILINTTVQPFYIDIILKEYYINILVERYWQQKGTERRHLMIQLCHDILFIIVQLVGSFDKQFSTKIVH